MASSTILYKDQVKPINWKPTRTELRDPKKLAESLGLTYDAGILEDKFNAATKAEYDAKREEFANTENAYYRNAYNAQNSSLDAIRKSNASAVATGASRGLQAANELSSILGMQQNSMEGATELANDRNKLYADEAAAYTKNVVDAIKQANETGLALGNLNANLYASDTQFDIGQMDYYAQLETAMKQLMAAQEQAEANRYGADKNLEGVKYNADKNLEGTRYTADKNYAGTKYAADANVRAAQARSYSYSSGGGGGSKSSSSGSSKKPVYKNVQEGAKGLADAMLGKRNTGNSLSKYAVKSNSKPPSFSVADFYLKDKNKNIRKRPGFI